MDKISPIKQNILQFIENQNITKEEFYKKTEIAASNFKNPGLKSELGGEKIAKILSIYPSLNAEWLITGQGLMFKTYKNNVIAEPVISNRKTQDAFYEIQRVPLFNLEATMGLVPLVDGNGIDEEKVIDYISIPNMPSSDGAIFATGDSMYPLLKSGDMIAYKRINLDRSNIFFGEMYVLAIKIDETETMKTIKFVHPSELGDDYIKIVSHNQHHAPKDIRLDQITAIALVRGSIRIHN